MMNAYDILIIGSGAAGLSLALKLPPSYSIALLSKAALDSGCTRYAQGGIASATHPQDSCEQHQQDTLKAGDGLCHKDRVSLILSQSQNSIQFLQKQGVPFCMDAKGQRYHLTQEGGHSTRRVLHVKDHTGKAIMDALMAHIPSRPHIKIFEEHTAIDLVTHTDGSCQGAFVLNNRTGEIAHFSAHTTILATGGASGVYHHTSNPKGVTGDGIAMAWRAGCRVVNMEFNQFHPTCLYDPHAQSFLLSEALRGEGAKLRLPDGKPFLFRFHPDQELAPRDVIARAIDHTTKQLGIDHVYLDISHKPQSWIRHHFPHIYRQCLSYGCDISRGPIPTVPAAHYTCGGIWVDATCQTDLPGLYAVGETAFTGLHGANRLASNSLLECLVTADMVCHAIINQPKVRCATVQRFWKNRPHRQDPTPLEGYEKDIRQIMWQHVGITRSHQGLASAHAHLRTIHHELSTILNNTHISPEVLAIRNLSLIALLITESAVGRKESRGLHYNVDCPNPLSEIHDTVLPGCSEHPHAQ